MSNQGKITFHNQGDADLYFFYVYFGNGASYTFCDIKIDGGVLHGHSDVTLNIPPYQALDWRFNSAHDCQQAYIVSSGQTSHDQANGQTIGVGS